jgi:magnesium-transporting ATPase (P-type)
VVKVNQDQRFPADLILLKSSNTNGMAYVETINLDGETYLKNKVAIRDMQDAILSPADASSINGHICCDHPDDFLYNFDGMMTIKVKNSEDSLKVPLSYN